MAIKAMLGAGSINGFNPLARLRSWGAPTGTLGLGFAVAAGLNLSAILLAPRWAANGSINLILGLMGANLLLILVLAAFVGGRAIRLIDAGDAGARLRARFVSQFALAAVTPALVVALFFSVMVTRGVDKWLGSEVKGTVSSLRQMAETYRDGEKNNIGHEFSLAADDVNNARIVLKEGPITFNHLLSSELEAHRLQALYVIDRQGNILARATTAAAPPYTRPPESSFAELDEGIYPITAPVDYDNDLFLPLIKLKDVPGAYLYGAWPLAPGMMNAMRRASDATTAYDRVQLDRGKIKTIFLLVYLETTLLVLVGAVWLGMAAASVLTAPMGRLVVAAGKVAGGDLSARVDAENDPEEISVLSHAFNRMTHDLQEQQDALRAAGEDADRRRQFMETVLAGVSAGVVGLDSSQHISAINQPAARLLGLDERTAVGRSLAEVAPELVDIAVDALETNTHPEEEVDVSRRGETRRLRVRAATLSEDGLVLTFDDITRLAAAQRNAAWKDVARRIAHEIKNPLTPIQLSAERIRRRYRKDIASEEIETFDRCTDTIIRQVGDIGRMVDEFSAFARMPAPRFTQADPAELLRQTVFAQRVASPELTVVIDEPIPDLELVCDPQMVSQALANLLKNAAEAVSARLNMHPEPPGKITARLMAEGGELAFEVEDNGIGLPDKDRERLTEPYVTTREKGAGLGLAIVKRIAEDHRGELTLTDARAGRGARAILRFPLATHNQNLGPQTAQAAS